MRTRNKAFITTLIVLVLLLIANQSNAAIQWFFNRNQLVWQSALAAQANQGFLPFTTYYIVDNANPDTCVMIVRDNATGQFSMTSVHPGSCSYAHNR